MGWSPLKEDKKKAEHVNAYFVAIFSLKKSVLQGGERRSMVKKASKPGLA